MTQAVEIQNLLYEATKEPGIKKLELSSLARAWADIEERRRILLGKPLPGVLKPEAKPRKPARIGAPQPVRRPQPVVVPLENPTPQ